MLKALFEGVDGLSDALLEKMQPMFEATVEEKLKDRLAESAKPFQDEIVELKEALAESAAHNVNEANLTFAEKVDQYLDMAVNEWVEKNAIGLQSTALAESAQLFLAKISQAATEFNTIIPESDVDEVARLTTENERLQERTSHALSEAAKARSETIALKREKIVESVSEGMTVLGASRLAESVKELKFESEESFKRITEGYRALLEKKMKEGDDEEDNKDETKDKEGDKEKDDKKDGKDMDEACGGKKKNEEFVDGTDKDYPKDLPEGKKKPIKEGVDLSRFGSLFVLK